MKHLSVVTFSLVLTQTAFGMDLSNKDEIRAFREKYGVNRNSIFGESPFKLPSYEELLKTAEIEEKNIIFNNHGEEKALAQCFPNKLFAKDNSPYYLMKITGIKILGKRDKMLIFNIDDVQALNKRRKLEKQLKENAEHKSLEKTNKS